MAHSDNNGLVLPPKLAPIQVVMIPIYKGTEELERIAGQLEGLAAELKKRGISVKIDTRDNVRTGFKFARIRAQGRSGSFGDGTARSGGQHDRAVPVADTLSKETVPQEGLADRVEGLLDEIQANIYAKALRFRDSMITRVDTYDEFKRVLDEKGGFILAHWDGTPETEELIKAETKATIRCIPVDAPAEEGVCIVSGKPSHRRVLFARSY